jgi:hypothetical protein
MVFIALEKGMVIGYDAKREREVLWMVLVKKRVHIAYTQAIKICIVGLEVEQVRELRKQGRTHMLTIIPRQLSAESHILLN